jgi:hypothetical protein
MVTHEIPYAVAKDCHHPEVKVPIRPLEHESVDIIHHSKENIAHNLLRVSGWEMKHLKSLAQQTILIEFHQVGATETAALLELSDHLSVRQLHRPI